MHIQGMWVRSDMCCCISISVRMSSTSSFCSLHSLYSLFGLSESDLSESLSIIFDISILYSISGWVGWKSLYASVLKISTIISTVSSSFTGSWVWRGSLCTKKRMTLTSPGCLPTTGNGFEYPLSKTFLKEQIHCCLTDIY